VRDAGMKALAKKMSHKSQGKMNQFGKAGEADRHIADKKPKHRFTRAREVSAKQIVVNNLLVLFFSRD